jgi:hypothetical protein
MSGFGGEADVVGQPLECPVLGVKQTLWCGLGMSAFSHNRTLIGSEKWPFFEHSQPRADDGHLVVRVPGLRLIDGLRTAPLPP